MNFNKEELKKYRIQRAFETFEEAELLFSERKILGTVNRLYYACFYAISAYLISKELKAITHAGVKIAFNKELIKTGMIDIAYGKFFNKLFVNRFEADYEDLPKFTHEEVKKMVLMVRSFIHDMENIIKTI